MGPVFKSNSYVQFTICSSNNSPLEMIQFGRVCFEAALHRGVSKSGSGVRFHVELLASTGDCFSLARFSRPSDCQALPPSLQQTGNEDLFIKMIKGGPFAKREPQKVCQRRSFHDCESRRTCRQFAATTGGVSARASGGFELDRRGKPGY